VITALLAEHEAGARAREAGEDQPGHHRQKRHAGEDFDGGDEVSVIGLRVHVAIADCRQRFDREVKVSEGPVPGSISDRLVAERIQESENSVERDKDRCGAGKKYRPVDRHRPMIEIGPKTWAQAERLDLHVAEPDDLRLPI
jgi:hypothetical protein